MALRKGIESPYGPDATSVYWTVRSVAEDYDREEISIAVLVHVDKASRNAGKEPLAVMGFNLTGQDYADFKALTGGMRQSAYTWLKTRPELAGAVDV